MDKIYIGIDYSLKSPGVTIYKNSKFSFITHCEKVEKPKKDILVQEDVSRLDDVFLSYQAGYEKSNIYSIRLQEDLIRYRIHSDILLGKILDVLENHKNKSNTNVYIGFEGFSFNSFTRSDNIIDIITATTTFKNKLIDYLNLSLFNSYEVHTYTPKEIKKFAGYGSYDKVDLFDVFIGDYSFIHNKYCDKLLKDKERISKGKTPIFNLKYKDDNIDINSKFYRYCKDYIINRDVKKPKVPKPIDDLIDSYFVNSILRSIY